MAWTRQAKPGFWLVKGDSIGLDDFELGTGDAEDFEEAAEAAMDSWNQDGSFAGEEIKPADLVVTSPDGVTRTVHVEVEYDVSFHGSLKEEDSA
jgi:hypothetical protein